jgi:biopolymer transport protein ExbD
MKIKGAKKVHYDSGPNMIPMVDIVMVIMIFMMMVGSFAGAEHYLVSSLPITSSGGGQRADSDSGKIDESLEVRVDRTLDAFVARFGGKEARTPAEVAAGLQQLHERMESAVQGSARETQIVISPGRNVQYVHLIDVYQSALQAGFEKVGFATAR